MASSRRPGAQHVAWRVASALLTRPRLSEGPAGASGAFLGFIPVERSGESFQVRTKTPVGRKRTFCPWRKSTEVPPCLAGVAAGAAASAGKWEKVSTWGRRLRFPRAVALPAARSGARIAPLGLGRLRLPRDAPRTIIMIMMMLPFGGARRGFGIRRNDGMFFSPRVEPSLFWWSDEKKELLLRFWENYILILETLEGNQIHVIKPVLPKLNSLFEDAVAEGKTRWLIHPSWHLCIYKRMFESENKTLVGEGVMHFLELWATEGLPSAPDFSEFIIGPLMDALSESSLYSRSPGQPSGSCSPVGMKLQGFLATYVAGLPEEKAKRSFLLRFIEKMSTRHWCAVPILFFSMALARIPRSCILGAEGLLALREVLQCTMMTHQVLLRGAAQGYLLQAALRLVDVETVSLSEMASFLACLRPEESLGRGTALWTEVCDWLRVNEASFGKSLNRAAAGEQEESSLNAYVRSLVRDYVKSPSDEGGRCFVPDCSEAKLVATMVLLATDAWRPEDRGPDGLRTVLRPLVDVLSKLGTNPYIPALRADRCLQLILQLLRTAPSRGSGSRDDEALTVLQNCLVAASESISDFLLRRLTVGELSTVADLDRCHLYLGVLAELVSLHPSGAVWSPAAPPCSWLALLKSASILHLQGKPDGGDRGLGEQIQKVVSMACLARTCEMADRQPGRSLDSLDADGTFRRFVSSAQFDRRPEKPRCPGEQGSGYSAIAYREPGVFLGESSTSRGWGKSVARYVHDQWVCRRFALNRSSRGQAPDPGDGTPPAAAREPGRPETLLRAALEALAVLPPDHVLPVFGSMKILIPELLNSHESLCVRSFDAAWKIVATLSNTQLVFWPNLKAFVQFAFDGRVLAVASRRKGRAHARLKEIASEMTEMSSTRTGVFNVLIGHCCRTWLASPWGEPGLPEDPPSSARDYVGLVAEACVFGPVFRRDQRLVQDVRAFVGSLGSECAANVVTESTNRDDHHVRVCAVKFLCLLDGARRPAHKSYVGELAAGLLEKEALVASSRSHYYANSLQHRVQNRVWQTLLVLFPKLDQDFLGGVVDKVFQAGSVSNQASVKYAIQWMIILILHRYPQFFPKFWDRFRPGEENFKTSMCTYLSVLFHLDVIVQNEAEMVTQLKKGLVVALQWCFSHNFRVRLYALVTLKKIWGLCKTWRLEECEALSPAIESSLEQVENTHGAGNAKRNWQRIQEHFFFAVFHPLRDYNLETIFYILPRLAELAEDEWIPLSKFTGFTDIPTESGRPSWGRARGELRDLRPDPWTQPDTGLNPAELALHLEGTDVQKKIIPWKNNSPAPPDLDLDLLFQDRAARLGKSLSGLIVVASLVAKPTNLGGLCRTCEIFGVSTLVLGSLQCASDKQFQHLSVSAEQWLPLLEVKPAQLVDYLRQRKADGYTIIGVEQTARSVDLTEYRFPEKSLLLLGNEREGIPAHLLGQLDVCVEIPQQGIVRSLNVHVSGALLIWEYTRQRLARRPRDGGRTAGRAREGQGS
uniref:tRNA (guanosine(18)-2'-O)-methyltransferase TARBP1 n=1 Tax=Ornithorhynchus anatinus TaxID=9258 RepID=F7FHV0_ORNAN